MAAFRTESGLSIDPQTVCFPIFGTSEDRSWRLLGTGFFVISPGVFVTAKHVLLKSRDPQILEPDLTIFQKVSSDDVRERRVRHVFSHPEADIALTLLQEWSDRDYADLKNRVLTLTKRRVEEGEPVLTYSYPFTEVESMQSIESAAEQPGVFASVQSEFDAESLTDVIQRVRIRASEHHGEVLSFHEDGVTLTRGRAYRTTMDLANGTSGGPVVDRDGMVFAVNSAGVVDRSDSTVSSIENLLEMIMPEVNMEEERVLKNVTVEDLILQVGGRIDA